MIKVVWLCQYNIIKLEPELKFSRKSLLHSSSWIHTLSEQLARCNEIELHIVTHSHLVMASQAFTKNNICFHVIKYGIPFTNRGFPWYLPLDKLTAYHQFTTEARKIISGLKPNILHVHGTEGGYFMPAFKLKIPYILSIQGITYEIVKVNPTLSGMFQVPFEMSAIKRAKHFACRTIFDSGYVRRHNKNAVIFDLPEAMNEVYFETEWNPDSQLSIVFVGTIIERKGIKDLINAIYKLKFRYPGILLKIIGSGSIKYIDRLKRMIVGLHLASNIIWLGTKEPMEIAKELSKSSIFVLPTLVDNSPNCIAEAMAVGIPTVATNIGGIPSMIRDNEDGFLFEKHDINRLVEIIHTTYTNKELQQRISIAAKAKAFDRYHPLSVVEKYIDVYNYISNGEPKNFSNNTLL